MRYKAYILTFDRDDDLDYLDFHEILTEQPEIISWFHYLKSSYILISDEMNAKALSLMVGDIVPGKRFLIVEVKLRNRNGWLPRDAWDWLRKHTRYMRR